MTDSPPIYLDYHATTTVDPRVAEKILHYMTVEFGNANSIDHIYGDRETLTQDELLQKSDRTRQFSVKVKLSPLPSNDLIGGSICLELPLKSQMNFQDS
ncbi:MULTISPECIES: hypothetical protein [Limnospira]|uniref:Cysteine desulfurase n=2 Tax=Limnospira TaxID=2596745 RepID=A0A9P1KII9_9CYAN|nr:hypothetical protein AmaxDRAFT_5189 [Limnospira maxima CS-328]EKD09480.1 aminotransferase class V [Arthrospira platensis C1]QJB24837.1 aminotransferase class V [Limnospira fusiformis SAG 85.79]QNH57117.1 MAG: aminotransferase class V [Limnospira indica BM01]RAQ42212.1 aminotransferase class V [Arthrospira sp. O9.13F]CDM97753.1 conserved protein of unknown function [Limnospira indica PCC 8005]